MTLTEHQGFRGPSLPEELSNKSRALSNCPATRLRPRGKSGNSWQGKQLPQTLVR